MAAPWKNRREASPSHMQTPQKCCRLALLGGFLAMLFLPGPLWLLLRGRLDTENHENRLPAAFPAGEAAVSPEQWPAAFDAWLDDHAPFRNQLMRLNARVNWTLGTLDSSDVLLGKEHWLFLHDVSDSKSLSDYQGLTEYTPEELAAVRDAVNALQSALSARGSRLVILIAPAKEGVYRRYMPDSVPVVRQPSKTQALAQWLQSETDAALVWPQQALCDAAQHRQVYYRYDTHWNEAGAYLAASQLLALLEKDFIPFESVPVSPDAAKAAPTDLANVSGAWALCTDDVYYTVDAPRAVCISDGGDLALSAWRGQGTGSVFLLRDSFGTALAPFLMAGFAEGTSIHGSAGAQELLMAQLQTMEQLPDVVVIEVAERFSYNLCGQAQLLREWAEGMAQRMPF